MEINDKLVSYAAELAHLKLDDDQRAQAAADLARMIGYVDQLSELDTDGVEPMSHAFPVVNVFREDEVKPSMERELIQAYYRCPLPGEEGTFVSTTDILSRINSAVKHYLSPVKIGLVMKQAGFELTRSNGKRGYRVVELPRN